MNQSSSPYVPVGTIVPWLGLSSSSVPAGWLLCNGTAKSRITYAALFAAVSTTYGAGDGSSTFNLPGVAQAAYASGNNHLTSNTPGSWAHSTNHRYTSSISVTNSAGSTHTHPMNTGTVNSNAISNNYNPDGAAAMGSHGSTNTNLGGPSATGVTYGGSSVYDAADSHGHALFGNAQAHGDHTHTLNTPSLDDEAGHSHTPVVTQDTTQTISSASIQPDHARLWHLIKI